MNKRYSFYNRKKGQYALELGKNMVDWRFKPKHK